MQRAQALMRATPLLGEESTEICGQFWRTLPPRVSRVLAFPPGALLGGTHAHTHGREAILLPRLQQALPAEAAAHGAPEEVP